MSDEIKHECAVALLRLLDSPAAAGGSGGAAPRSLPDPGGTLLSLLLEKQHNRGQDGAGAAVLSLAPEPGRPAWWIRKSASATALADLLGAIGKRHGDDRRETGDERAGTRQADTSSVPRLPSNTSERIFLGHLRYATYGRGDESFCHPFVHAEPRLDRTLFLAGNFNLTNTHELFEEFRKAGNHPGSSADGYLICELLAAGLEGGRGIAAALRAVLPKLDGAFTLCGMTGDGWAFAVRDAHGIRPGWYHASPRAVAVASERPAIQAALDCPTDAVRELPPGVALLVSPAGEVRFERVLDPAEPRPCVFERIYFSRANDADIHRERKALGAALAAPILRAVDFDLDRTFFSYIPNSAQVAFHGLLEALWTEGLAEGRPVRFGQVAVKDAKFRTFIADAAARREIGKHVYDVTYGLVRPGVDTLVVLDDSIVRGTTMREAILPMLDRLGPKRIVVASSAPPIRYPDCYGIDMSTLGELVAFRALVNLLGDETEAALRDALETLSHAEFAEFESHAESAENAEPGSSHVSRLASLFPHAESAENAETSSFAAKRHPSFAAERHPSFAAERHPSFAAERHPSFVPQAHPSFVAERHPSFVNPLAALYARFTEEQHAAKIARLLTPPGMRAQVSVVYQTVPALHAALSARGTPPPAASNSGEAAFERAQSALGTPATPTSNARDARFGDWYFTGDYPTPGGYRVLRRSLENHLARREGRSY